MRLLLDTNIYVFMISDRKSLSKNVCAYLEDPENLKYLSIISLQELITAFRTKKLLSDTKFPFYRKQGLRLIENK